MTTREDVSTIRALCQELEDLEAAVVCVNSGSSHLVTTRYVDRPIATRGRFGANEARVHINRDTAIRILMETRRDLLRRLEDFGIYLDPDNTGKDII